MPVQQLLSPPPGQPARSSLPRGQSYGSLHGRAASAPGGRLHLHGAARLYTGHLRCQRSQVRVTRSWGHDSRRIWTRQATPRRHTSRLVYWQRGARWPAERSSSSLGSSPEATAEGARATPSRCPAATDGSPYGRMGPATSTRSRAPCVLLGGRVGGADVTDRARKRAGIGRLAHLPGTGRSATAPSPDQPPSRGPGLHAPPARQRGGRSRGGRPRRPTQFGCGGPAGGAGGRRSV